MAKPAKDTSTYEGFGYFYNRLVSYVTEMTPAARKSKTVIGLIIVLALSVLASFPFIDAIWYKYVQTIIGFPAGVILFVILLGFKENTRMGQWKMFEYKANHSAIQRIRGMLIVVAVIILLLIFVGAYIPYGVGGTLIVAAALTIYNVLRRTPEEIAMAKQGIVDPRDIKPEEEEE